MEMIENLLLARHSDVNRVQRVSVEPRLVITHVHNVENSRLNPSKTLSVSYMARGDNDFDTMSTDPT